MSKAKKKGSKHTGLIIVIVVIILVGAMVPTLYFLNKKNNYLKDEENALNLDSALASEEVANIIEAKEALNKKGYSNAVSPKSKGYHYYWCLEDSNIYLVDDSEGFLVSYPITETNVTSLNSYRLDLEYYKIICAIDGISADKKIVEAGQSNVQVTLTASGVNMPEVVKIGSTTYSVNNNSITIPQISSNMIIVEVPKTNCLEHYDHLNVWMIVTDMDRNITEIGFTEYIRHIGLYDDMFKTNRTTGDLNSFVSLYDFSDPTNGWYYKTGGYWVRCDGDHTNITDYVYKEK